MAFIVVQAVLPLPWRLCRSSPLARSQPATVSMALSRCLAWRLSPDGPGIGWPWMRSYASRKNDRTSSWLILRSAIRPAWPAHSAPASSALVRIEVARALTVDTTGDGAVDQYGFVFPTVTHAGVETTATSFLFEYDPDGHWVNEAGELNRDAITFAWTQMRRLIADGSVPLGLDNNAKRQFWVEGRAAMMLEGPWIQGNINSAADGVREGLQVAATPFAGTVYGGASNVLAVPADIDPDRQELAWKFIELFTSEEWQSKYASVAGQPPARAGVLDDAFLAANANMQRFVAEANAAKSFIPPGMEENFTRFRDLVVEATLAAVVQEQDIDAVLNQLERDIARLR